MDLTPRDAALEEYGPRRRPLYYVVGLLFAVIIGFLLFKGIGDATEFFLNADEAVEQKDDLAQRRFRLQGRVVAGTVVEDGDRLNFTVEFNAVQVDVRHNGTASDLFQEDIPVVLIGNWNKTGEYFVSSQVLVKHTNEYEADNEDRLDKAKAGEDPLEDSD